MRIKQVMVFCLLLPLVGCVKTQTHTSSLGKSLPQSSKADQDMDAARVHTELAQHYLAEGDPQTALQKLLIALKFEPDYIPAHTVIALVYERVNDLPDAELHYRRAVALDPSKGATNNNLGVFLCATGRGTEGLGYFQKAAADPFYQTPDRALVNAGRCQMKQNDTIAAEASFRAALAHDPNSAEALFQLANALYMNNDAFHALAFMQRLDAQGAPTASSLKLGFDIESRLGNVDAALNYRKRLQSQFPDSDQARALFITARQ